MLKVEDYYELDGWVLIRLKHSNSDNTSKYSVMVSKKTNRVRLSPNLYNPLNSLRARAALQEIRRPLRRRYGIDIVNACATIFRRLKKTGST